MGELQYLPLPLPFFSFLAGVVLILLLFLQFRALTYAYTRLGVSPGGAVLLLVGSLVGSYFNLPVIELAEQHIRHGRIIEFHGIGYIVPMVIDRPGTVIAVNVGGALIPGAMSIVLLARHRLWARGLLATFIVAVVCHQLADPVPGLGIALPIFVPALTTGVVALVIARERAAPLAYIGGSLGTLIGADLSNLGHVRGLGAPVVSIGGAGTFDGIFLIGILAVLIASLMPAPRRELPPPSPWAR